MQSMERDMRHQLKIFDERCREKMKREFLNRAREKEELEAANMVKRFLVDEATYYQVSFENDQK